MLNKKIEMPRTDSFLTSCLAKKVFDNVEFLFNGYDITKKDKIVSVRLNEGGKALINCGRNLKEVVSARLDNLLHKFIVNEFYPLQKSVVNGKTVYSTFIPVENKDKNVEFIDSAKNTYKLANVSNEGALGIYRECLKNSADDVLFKLENFVSSSVKTDDKVVPTVLISNSLNIENYAVSPCSAYVQETGKTIVGEFLTSSADKKILSRFEARLNGDIIKSNVNPNTDWAQAAHNVRYTPEFQKQYRIGKLNNANNLQKFLYELDKEYNGNILHPGANGYDYNEVMSLVKAIMKEDVEVNGWRSPYRGQIEESFDRAARFDPIVSKADSVVFTLKNSKDLTVTLDKKGVFSASFNAMPNLEPIKNALFRGGKLLEELESGLRLDVQDDVAKSILSSVEILSSVDEKEVAGEYGVSHLVGAAVTSILSSYGIDDQMKVFDKLTQFKLA